MVFSLIKHSQGFKPGPQKEIRDDFLSVQQGLNYLERSSSAPLLSERLSNLKFVQTLYQSNVNKKLVVLAVAGE